MSKKIENLSFEESLNYLDSIIKELESNDITLEESLKKYEEGIAVARSNQKN
ncbi:exodeoxyribonuclease VII small subunit [Paraphotobacterium marinum]|uniref:Exodeoxyribonuclease VII small subunit n=1 Tax=Paraphotobacterium marinum TaxID=1755811 RepID=A0A220VDM5_9GAMM|nr:exodeoxyribonuclease VII small subunit [Paraphotobacterium marinum]ASK78465.1 exodeoxyribonuclease VII small subunit [Paraphotobacterium marinum]